mgnify:CR=1 FL=1
MHAIKSYPTIIPAQRGELSRLLTAAVVNQGFCNLLLTNPANALASGFHGETFRLAFEDKERILNIQAKTLAEFASQLPLPLTHPVGMD